jgi:adenylate cyclase
MHEFKKRSRFQLSLIIAIPALVVITGGLIVFFTLSNTRRTMEDFGWALFRESTNKGINDTRNSIRGAIPDIETLSNLYRQGFFQKDLKWQARYFAELLRSHREYSWVSFADEQGNFTGAYRPDARSDGLRLNVSWLKNRKTESFDYDLLENGNLQVFKHDLDSGYDPRTRPFYELAKKTGKRVWTEPYIFYEQAVPGITCAVPVFDRRGKIAGVFSIDFDLNGLSEIVAKARVSERGVIFVFTENRTMLGHPTIRVVSKTGQRGEGKLLNVWDVPDANIKAYFAALDSQRAPATGDERRNFRLQVNGEQHLATYARFEIDENLHWILGIVAPEKDFRGIVEVRENYIRAYGISLAAIVLSLLLAIVFTRLISSPLRSISRDMEKVGRLEIDNALSAGSVFSEISAMNQQLQNMKGGLRSFASYVPKDLVRDLLKSGKEARLEGSTETLTVLFTDIAGFTTFAEKLEPDALVQKLGKYFEIMTKNIMRHHGTVDKFIGDGIMAFWGAPAADASHAVDACRAALGCVDALRALARSKENGSWAKQLRTRFGIATGPVLVGNIGTHERMNYTAMGDTVNLSSRLEGINKIYHTSIIASESTYQLVKEKIIGRALDIVAVKGKFQGVRIYEILGLRAKAGRKMVELEKISDEGLNAFIAEDMKVAKAAFRHILKLQEDDAAARALLKRIEEYEKMPDKKSWSAVLTLASK